MKWAGHVAGMGEGRNVYRVLVGKPEGKSQLERPRRRWEDEIKMDLRELGWGCVEWTHLAQDRDRWRAVVNAVMNLRVLASQSSMALGRHQWSCYIALATFFISLSSVRISYIMNSCKLYSRHFSHVSDSIENFRSLEIKV
jgi:hypothetical protein